MFGHNKDDQNQDDQSLNQPAGHVVEPVANGSLSAGSDATTHVASEPSGPPPTTDENRALPPPGFVPFAQENNQASPPAADDGMHLPDDHDQAAPAVSDELLGIKKQALAKLNPLIGQLDQSPEEKFKTTMMMIQATDDKNLINQAYEAAQNIPDEKARAQALLDVVNEINYFTQQQK